MASGSACRARIAFEFTTGLTLDRRRDALPNRVGANGARIIPGDSARSVLYQRLIGKQAGPQMPPSGLLSEPKIKLIRAWIDQGSWLVRTRSPSFQLYFDSDFPMAIINSSLPRQVTGR